MKSVSKSNKRNAVTDKMFISLFLTGSVIELSQVGSGFIDGVVISRFLGHDAMAAEGIIHPVFSILGMISGLLAVGMQVRCSQEIGRGSKENFSRFVSAAVYAGVIASLLITVLLLAFAKPFAVLLGASGNAAALTDTAAKYLTGISIGAPPLIMTAVLAPAFQLDTGRKIIGRGAIIEAVSNVILDIAAIKLGWGIFGIGLATALASYMNLLYLCTFFFRKNRMLHFVKPDIPVREFLRMLVYGSEKAVRRLANTLRPIILNTAIISYGGTAAMSAFSVRNNFSNFAEIFGAGIASAVSLLTGVYYGEINAEGIEAVDNCKNRMIFLCTGAVCVLMFFFAKPVACLYITEDGAIYDMAVFALRVLAIQIPLQALVESRIKYLQAIHLQLNMNLLTIVTRLIFVVLSAYFMGKLFGDYGILACCTVSDALTLISIYIFNWIRLRGKRLEKRDFLHLPDSFYLNPGDEISLNVRSEEDACLVSEQIMLFCRGHKIDSRTGYLAALSFEELAVNIVRHGFPKNSSSTPMIDMRTVITDDNLVIRIRDNCPYYDVTAHLTSLKDEIRPEHNIGTRIVSNMASDITYLRTFGSNSLILCFKTKKMRPVPLNSMSQIKNVTL